MHFNNSIENDGQRSAALKNCFDCMARLGLERTSMRDFLEAANMSASSFYYRFKNKDEVVMEAAYLGLLQTTKELFWVAATKVTSYPELFDAILSNVEMRKENLRLIYQIAASPRYGAAFRDKVAHISAIYDMYTELISKHLNCSAETLKPYVNLFIATIREYVVWENRSLLEEELNFIYNEVVANCMDDNKKQYKEKSV